MNVLARAIRQHILDSIDALGLSGFQTARAGGGGLMSRIAAAGILRLALRWPALSVIVIVSVLAARLMAKRTNPPGNAPPVLRAP
ncbi:MAG TPA: hypothetical protein VKA83_23875 [Methylomirabilota bacterium]|jgi:hypothetical protein|nr:hypothetical protein [Methylomirabilota bacterium]